MASLDQNFINKTFSIICDDPGGANLIFELIKKKKIKSSYFHLSRTAKKTNSFFKKIKNTSIKTIINKSENIVIGSSSNFEFKILKLCTKNKKNILLINDHWNKKWSLSFFEKSKKIISPTTEIWCVSNSIYLKLKKIIKNAKIKLIKNPILEKINSLKKKNFCENNILYLSEPTHKSNRYDASACLNYFLNNISYIQGNLNKIIIRPHPKENLKKIKNIKKKFPKLKIIIRSKNNIFEEIMNSKYVAGCNTVPMYYALYSKKKVFCAINKNNIKSGILDHENNKLIYLRELLKQ